jgi:hypothetical protein
MEGLKKEKSPSYVPIEVDLNNEILKLNENIFGKNRLDLESKEDIELEDYNEEDQYDPRIYKKAMSEREMIDKISKDRKESDHRLVTNL